MRLKKRAIYHLAAGWMASHFLPFLSVGTITFSFIACIENGDGWKAECIQQLFKKFTNTNPNSKFTFFIPIKQIKIQNINKNTNPTYREKYLNLPFNPSLPPSGHQKGFRELRKCREDNRKWRRHDLFSLLSFLARGNRCLGSGSEDSARKLQV